MVRRVDGHQMAESSLFDLPAELRTLVDFLQSDNRPTAILGRRNPKCDGQVDAKTTYQNPAFKLLELGARDIECLMNNLEEIAKSDDATTEVPTVVVDGRFWRLNFVAEKWRVLVCSGILRNTEEMHTDTASDTASPDSGIGLDRTASEHPNGVSEPKSVITSQDWTQFPLPDMSPWIEHIRKFDWASTDLGPMHAWPHILRGYVMHIMINPNPRLIIWGDHRTFIYNEACIPLFGEKHSNCLGKPVEESWAEIWDDIGPLVESSFKGQMNKLTRMPLPMHRTGYLEETYWDLLGLPIVAAEGHVAGQYLELTEVTKVVKGDRRRGNIMKLHHEIGSADSLHDLW